MEKYGDLARGVVRAAKSVAKDSPEKLVDRAAMNVPSRSLESDLASAVLELAGRDNVSGGRVREFRGRRMVGSPTVGQVTGAAESGRLRVERSGRVSTPEVRRTKKAVRKASKKLKRARSRVGGKPALRRAGLDSHQAHVLSTVLSEGRSRNAPRKGRLAAVETAIQESGIRNLSYGDADSAGWRQERAMYYKDPQNLSASARRFFDEMEEIGYGPGLTAGQLAQAVQRSAYPDRYDEREAEALPLLRAFASGGSPGAVDRLNAAKQQARVVSRRADKLGVEGVDLPKGTSRPKNLGKPPKKTVTRFKAMNKAAQQLEDLAIPYVYGGNHIAGKITDPAAGLDCSSAVSYVLQKAGVLDTTLVSGDFGSVTKPGPGAVTILYNPGHVLMKIGDRYFGTSGTNPQGGAGWIDKSLGDSEMASGKYQIGHIPGMGKKVALQLGVDPAASKQLPGMEVSSDGTTATMTSAAVERATPGFSDRPIKATPLERLKDLGFVVTPSGVRRKGKLTLSKPKVDLDALEKKYA